MVGQHENIGTVTATTPGGTVVPPVTDPANYFGVQGGIDIEKTTNGVDADLPPGPYVLAGGAVSWEYTVTNIGNSQSHGHRGHRSQGGHGHLPGGHAAPRRLDSMSARRPG